MARCILFINAVSVISSDLPCNARFTTIPLKPLSDHTCRRYCRFTTFYSVQFWLTICVFLQQKCTSHSCEETTIKKLLKLSKLISHSYLIKQSFSGYRCESEIAIFAWKVPWNYASSLTSVYSLKNLFTNRNFCITIIFKQNVNKRLRA